MGISDDNWERKDSIVHQIESLAADVFDHRDDWNDATERLKSLKDEYHQVGFVNSRRVRQWLGSDNPEGDLRDRISAALDWHFKNKRDFFEERRAEFEQALQDKISLVSEAERLLQLADSQVARTAFKRLQQNWRGIHGGDPDGDLWARFQAIGNKLFAKPDYATRLVNAEEVRQLAETETQKRAIIGHMMTLSNHYNLKGQIKIAKDLRNRWNALPRCRPAVEQSLRGLFKQAEDAFWQELKRRHPRPPQPNSPSPK